MGSNGLFAVGRPIAATPDGYRLEVIGAEVTQALAIVLKNVKVPFETGLVRRIMQLFWDTRDPEEEGFGYEQTRDPTEPHDWTTALCVLALDEVKRLLDSTICDEVLKHFTVRRPPGPTLDALFYQDIGLARAADGRPSQCCCTECTTTCLAYRSQASGRSGLWCCMARLVRERARFPKRWPLR